MEGSVNPGCDILGLVWFELETRVVGELKGAVIHGCHRGRAGLLPVGLGVRLRWTTFHPSGAGEAATAAKDLDGPLGGGGGGLGSPFGVGAAGGFAFGLCLEAERSGAFGEGSGGGGGGSGGGGACCCLDDVESAAGAWSIIVTSLETAVGGGLGVGTPCPGKVGATSGCEGFTFFQIFSSSSCCWRLRFASAMSWPESCSTVRVRVASWEALDSTALERLEAA